MSDESVVEHLVELDDASRLLLRAAALIEERGLCKTGAFEHKGHICFHASLSLAAGEGHWGSHGPVWHEANQRASDGLSEFCSRWIERPEVTKEMCVARLRSVALGQA